ncbi:hypothetical protein EfmAA818_26780 [Enterococcus faecium]|nr:hypothetical protein EfmAA818_26780 [Enterococcus faecium]
MFKVYFPFQWLVKGILLVLLGLIRKRLRITNKARHFPEEKPIKIVTKDLKISVNYQYYENLEKRTNLYSNDPSKMKYGKINYQE